MSVESTTDAPEHLAELNAIKGTTDTRQEVAEEEIEAVSQPEVEDGTQEETDESATSKAKKGKGLDKRFAELTREREEAKAYANAQAQKAAELEARLAEFEKSKPQPQEPQNLESPRPENFDTYDAYIDALTDYKLDLREKNKEAEKAKQEQLSKEQEIIKLFEERKQAAAAKYADFDEVIASARDIDVTPAMESYVIESEYGPEVAYFLAKNKDLAAEISQMSYVKAIASLGKIEAQFEKSSGAETKVTSAPKPVTPLKGGSTHKIDLTNESNYEAWKAERNKQLKRG